MCRFVAYLGQEPILLSEVIAKPSNSLISQSHQAKEKANGLNADGFGIGWYNPSVNAEPGLFRSIQPAWNDDNLHHIASKIESNCFVGHVRASTVGDVTSLNCHPFSHQSYLFAHNGTIRNFKSLKRTMINTLSDAFFNAIKGQTDSEHFFALMMDSLHNKQTGHFLDDSKAAFKEATDKLRTMQTAIDKKTYSRLNTVLTNGQELFATRYVSPHIKETLSLYYTTGTCVKHENRRLMHREDGANVTAIIIASEPLTDFAQSWKEIPINHMLTVDQTFNVSIETMT